MYTRRRRDHDNHKKIFLIMLSLPEIGIGEKREGEEKAHGPFLPHAKLN